MLLLRIFHLIVPCFSKLQSLFATVSLLYFSPLKYTVHSMLSSVLV